MPRSTVNIKVLLAAGATLPDAIRTALPGRPADFARRHGFPRSHVSRCMYGVRKHERVRVALAKELDVDRAWLDQQLDEYGRTQKASRRKGGAV